ncbi:hypothetical protein [Limnohabitans radicicola]|uniref:Uncharacterized protein n=1 Tax=Limnohabitans radicicola TaxID=2771427 RepID=A0A927INA4_9BURK|nr:hypothetical protein [Limnohabitans radicicola]MBD8052011.1 hypothetical protein [Limnohabitans radicicola]
MSILGADPFGSFGSLDSLRGPLREEFQRKYAEAFMADTKAKMQLENERLVLENERLRNQNEAERIRLAAELAKLQGQTGNSSFKPKSLHVVNG